MDSKKQPHIARQVVHNIRRCFGLLWLTDKAGFLISFGLMMADSLFPIGISYMARLMIDGIIKQQGLAVGVGAALLFIFLARYSLELLDTIGNVVQNDYFNKIFRFRFEHKVREIFLQKMSALDIQHFEQSETQNLILKAREAYPWRLINFSRALFWFIGWLVTVVGSFIILLQFGFWVPIVMIIATIPILWIKRFYTRIEWIIYNDNVAERKDIGYVADVLESRETIKELRVAQASDALLKRLRALQHRLFLTVRDPLRKYLPLFLVASGVNLIVFALLVYLKLPVVVAGAMSIGAFTFYVQMLSNVSRGTQSLVVYFADLYEHNLYVGYFFDTLDLPQVVKQPEPGYCIETIEPPRIEFRNVSFHYPNGTSVLNNISFVLEPGQHLAIVGPNGAGKTTLTNLLLRFYDPTHGQILINDVDLRDFKTADWYKYVAVLFQNFVQFELTIRDNILLGDSSVIDDQRMYEAARKSGADTFINELPRKYDQRLGKRFEDSTELSRGQWQKLALARMFYENAPILILDEPTSAIDAEAEAEIFDNLYETYKGKNLILISHRFSTVRNADIILVLNKGEIVEQGNHRKLMDQGGIYATMFKKQAKGYLD